jgi:cyclophilin family peptidyl-prolyl cis-trans isomerase
MMFGLRSLSLSLLSLLGLLFSLSCGGSAPPPAKEEPAAEKAPAPEAAPAAPVDLAGPGVEMKTSMGTMVIELYPDKAPKTVENFLRYVSDGFYDGTIFHRVVRNFVIQGGGFTPDMNEKATRPPIENEAANGLLNLRGTLSMARTDDPNSATSQFFINTKDNPPLDHRDVSVRGYGYAVFGKVVSGLEVLDAIGTVATSTRGPYDDVPNETVVIESVRVIN